MYGFSPASVVFSFIVSISVRLFEQLKVYFIIIPFGWIGFDQDKSSADELINVIVKFTGSDSGPTQVQ